MWDQDPGILLLPLSLLLPIRVQFQGLGSLGSTSPPPALTSQPIFLTESRHASQRYCAFSLGQDLRWEAGGMGRGYRVPQYFVSHLWDPRAPAGRQPESVWVPNSPAPPHAVPGRSLWS